MTELKCPFCQQELLLSSLREGDEEHQMWTCLSCQLSAQRKLWHEFIRTRKAFGIAVDAIKNATEYLGNQEPLVDVMAMNLHTDLSKALEQITLLEQKDVK